MRDLLNSKGVSERIMFYSLYGSQNYDADLIGADYDYHVYVFYGKDKMLGNTQKSKTYKLENGSIRVHDVRNLLNGFENLNINSLEIFESEYMYACPELKNLVAIIRRQNLLNRAVDTNKARFVDVSTGILKSYQKDYEKSKEAKKLVRMTMFYAISYALLNLSSQDVKFSDSLKVFDRNACLRTQTQIDEDSKFAEDLLEMNIARLAKLQYMKEGTDLNSEKRKEFEKNLSEVKVMLVRVLARL